MMNKTLALICIVSIAAVVACSPRINPFDVFQPIPVSNVYQLKRDTTSKQEVEQMFGRPLRTSINERGELYNYAYFGDSLFVQFNNQGIVSRFTYEPEPFRIEYDNQDILSRNFPARVLRRVIPARTRLAELTPMFGRPNRSEIGTERRKTTFIGRNENLIVYSRIMDDLVISHELQPK